MKPSRPPTIYCSEHGSGYSIKTDDLNALRNTLGDELLVNFLRAFVHVDRLSSLIDFGMQSVELSSSSETRSRRNLHAVVWFIIGTLHEIAIAIRDTKSALIQSRTSECNSKAWQELLSVEKRWKKREFKALRNSAAFHVEPKYLKSGLNVLLKEDGPVSLIEMTREAFAETSFRIGEDVLMRGMDMDDPKIDRILQNIADDLQACQKIENAFIEVLQSLGCKFEER